MRASEFEKLSIKLRFFGRPGMLAIMEAYLSPDNELEIVFDKRFEEYDESYYQAKVIDKQTNKTRLLIDFVLRNDSTKMEVGNIYPILEPGEEGKTVHTTSGSYQGGVDMGTTGMRWFFRKIKEFAKSQGFDISAISSSTRYTGIRAKNDPEQSDLSTDPKHYDVTRNIKESIIFGIDEKLIVIHEID